MRTAFLGEEHEAFRARVRTFLDRAIRPRAAEWDERGRVPPDGWRAFADEGLLALDHGGPGFLLSAIFLEELGALGYAGVRAAIGVDAFMAASYLDLFGTAEQRTGVLGQIRRGERIAALAITEEDAGSELGNLGTRAMPRPDGSFVVDGEKCYVANGSVADVVVTLVRTGQASAAAGLAGMSLLLIDATSQGLAREAQAMLGWRAADVCRLGFRGVVVPADRLIGRRDRALLHIVRALDFERLVAGLLAVGGVRHCLDLLNNFVREHHVGNAPLSAKQSLRHRLADLDAEFELVRQYAYHVAWQHSTGALEARAASIVKLRATELAVTAARVCVQYHGARGYLSESTAARLYRDAMAGTIAAGASEVMRDIIFQENYTGRRRRSCSSL